MSVTARFVGLARLLLIGGRTFILAATLASMSSCVMPIGPDFQDPLASTNYYPIIEDSSPPEGSVVFGMQSTSTTFKVVVSDPNIIDTLYVRWLADFPPSDDNTRFLGDQIIQASLDGSQLHEPASVEVTCQKLAPSIQTHQITVIVADRIFDSSSLANLDKLKDPVGLTRQATWFLNLECQ